MAVEAPILNQSRIPQHRLCDRLLLGMTGSVGAIAVPQFVLNLRQGQVRDVRVMMSQASTRFITPYTMQLCSGHPVFVDGFEGNDGITVPHIELTRRADLLLIMPATANILAKAAIGLCDDLVSTAIVACPAPVVLVPSMNKSMWTSTTTRCNVERVRALGYHVLEPGAGVEISNMQPIQ